METATETVGDLPYGKKNESNKLVALEIQDLSLPATVLLPRLDDWILMYEILRVGTHAIHFESTGNSIKNQIKMVS